MRNLYDKYMKMEQDCQNNLNIAKEWQNEVDRLQGKMEKYQKVVSQLERELKAAKTQVHRVAVSAPEPLSDREQPEELVPSDALLRIKQKYPIQPANNQSWQGS